jgi:hypothetical protein
MAVLAQEATIEDLYQVKQKAEVVNGEIILTPPPPEMPQEKHYPLCSNYDLLAM